MGCYNGYLSRLMVFLAVVKTFVSGGRVVAETGTLCPNGWTYFRDFSGGGLCILPVLGPRSWETADEYCTERHAHLINLDMANQYSFFIPEEESSFSLGGFLFANGYKNFWSGIHVRDGRVYWSAYGPELVERLSFRPWDWQVNQPSKDSGNCGMVNLGSRDEESINGVVTVFNNQYLVALGDCGELKSFVCQKPAIPDVVENSTKCEAEWVGNTYLPDCYRIFNAPADLSAYDTAEKECQNIGGEIAPFVSTLDQRIASAVNDYFFVFKEEPGLDGIWIYNNPEQSGTGECQALRSEFSKGGLPLEPVVTGCDTPLPFMCRKPARFEAPGELQIMSSYTSQTELLNYQAFTPLPVSCKLSRPPVDSETLFFHTPAGIINSTNNWQDSNGFNIQTSGPDEVPYFFNITIPEVIVPARKRREIGYLGNGGFKAGADEMPTLHRTKRQTPSESEIVRTVGYYSCGFHSLFLPLYKESDSILVRYSEKDLYIYIANVIARQESISPEGSVSEGGVSQGQIDRYNLLKDDSYVFSVYSYMGSLLNSLQIETSWSLNVDSYKAELEKISGRTFKFRVFVAIRNSRISSLDFEQEVMRDVGQHWSSRLRQNNFFQSVDFKSTVTCPDYEYFDQDSQRNAFFPATNIGETARSVTECYLGTSPVATAECQGGYDDGAAWGPVTFTDNCQTEVGGLCPEGWTLYNHGDERSCVMPVKSGKSWTEAAKYCKENEGYLLKLDDIDRYYSNSQQGLGQYLYDEDIKEFWSGMNVEKGRLFWDSYNPEFVIRQKFDQRSWRWGTNQPSTADGNCGKVSLGSQQTERFDETTQEAVVVNVFNNQYDVALSDCQERMQFVCERSPISNRLYYTNKCDEGWVSNLFLQSCYKVFNAGDDLSTYQAAEQKCRDMGGALPSVSTVFDRTIVTAVNDFYLTIDYEYSDLPTGEERGTWIFNPPEDPIVDGVCKAFDYGFSDGRVFDTINMQCDTILPFICVKQGALNDPIELDFTSPYNNQDKLQKRPPFTPLPLMLSLSRAPLSSEMIYVKTPVGIINSTGNWKITQGFTIDYSEPTDRPYYVNITIPYIEENFNDITEGSFNDITEGSFNDITRGRRGAGFPVIRTSYPSANEIERTVGFYSFGLRTLYPPAFIDTPPTLVRYSELDLYIYVAKVLVAQQFIQPEGLTQEDLTAFSLLNDESYLGNIFERADLGFMRSLNIEEEWREYLHTYRAVFEKARGRYIYFRVYVGLMNSRSLPEVFEQTVMAALQAYWSSEIRNSEDVFVSVQFKSTVACPLMTDKDGESGRMATFPATRIGETAYSWERCYEESGAFAIAECEGSFNEGASWGSVTFKDDCEEIPDLPESESTVSLKDLAETIITRENVRDVLKNTTTLTLPEVNITEADVIYVADILYNNQLYGVSDDITLGSVFDIVDNVLDTVVGVIERAQRLDNSANRIIGSLDEINHQFQLLGRNTKRLVRNFVAADLWQQSPADRTVTIGISLENNQKEMIDNQSLSSVMNSNDVSVSKTDAAIYLPADLILGKNSRLSFLIYGKTDLFMSVNGRYKTNSKVAAARLSIEGEPITDLGDDIVTAVFLPFESHEDLTCGFWDYDANEDGGGWNTEGCTISFENDRVVCKCDHLTNFAVLIDLGAHEISDIHKQILSIITIIGLSLSIVGLGLTILGFLMFKHLRNGRGQQVLVMLSVSMLCSAIIFLVGMDKTSNRAGCIAVAVLLHYFILVSFMWMLVEGVLQYLRFVKVLGTYIPNFLIKSSLPAWGLPLIPIIIILAIDYDMYYGGKGYCWLSTKPMLYGFIIPVALVILANLIVFTLVLCNLFRRRNKAMHINQSERKMAFLHFQAALSIFVILGLTWVFGFLAIDDARIAFHYIFAILNAFQGFFIFLLFTMREKKIRQAWAKFCCGRKYKEKASAQSSSDTREGRKGSHDTSGMTGSTGTSGSGPKFDNLSQSNGNRGYRNGRDHLDFRNPQFDGQ